jgi:hypothetical protein
LTVKGEEPELRLMAYAVSGGDRQPVVLTPAWADTTYVLSAERAQGSSEDAPVAAEIGACLVLDGQGRLLCTTNLGVTACADTRTGQLLWLSEPRPDPRQQGSFRSGPRKEDSLDPPPEPAHLVGRGVSQRAVYFAGSRLVEANPEDGTPVWDRDVGECHRLLVGPRRLVAYGGSSLVVFAPDGTRLTSSRERMERPVVGEGVQIGDTLLFPALHASRGMRSRGAPPRAGERRSMWIDRYAFPARGGMQSPRLVGSTVLARLKRPANLALVPGGVLAASRDRVVFLHWK